MLTLATDYYPPSKASQSAPVLVFVHGLLGKGEDWQVCYQFLKHFPILTVDLPCHGKSHQVHCDGFNHACQAIDTSVSQALTEKGFAASHPIILIGYSLGGRLAMYGMAHQSFSSLSIAQVIIEGGNFGLLSDDERNRRWKNDTQWAERFRSEDIGCVLSDWYQQSVFSSLNDEQRQDLIQKRSNNIGTAIANMLLSTSLAKQPDLRAALQSVGQPFHYVCGSKDLKFRTLAEQSHLPFTVINDAGHNVHQEQPKSLALCIENLINH
ncbi:2-succinyl-6-hydroxy-2,4-cyclohexadiene-1-carboxylate synthase [Vibrio sp. 10N.286.49.B3]|uniref:2-succinyl-6-hydroxy-2, 4-cyclohexadiene-1-carboxylate synthase n=1 Tax=Vibrio sp. 10N.286.49.B3 TaxID=1880855 RepID=UPI000C84E879|nr:2-succinyl-6-hydroxy-2,4-cyclohexadiene-1-carboxylate synthase [Vibrio sp. 10N.286.49.B3]PMH41868.1 2-succinyl-6-hydroxy-2,4-cyclohexadiene-1-carboxylate synthase [Vibrio sp. 10N.286.49.B3]